jgi:menaquinone reductase, molybdopterin-binding-like subunit
MERRDFFKVAALTGAAATLDSCGKPDQQLIRFVPDETLVPGIATWKPSICTLCPAGCGLIVRVMQGEAEVVRKGQLGIIKMGLAKKLEGNPMHPVNRGTLCARGQAGLQVVYHPDRLRGPLKRSGDRGAGTFQEISWDDAIKELTSQLNSLHSSGGASSLAFLTSPLRGQRRELIDRFLKAYGAPPSVAYEPLDDAVLRQANLLSFGWPELPTLDLARADYVISFGADFLGTWNSPVSQSIGYGEMRQGRVGHRGRFVQVEARMSQTGANADEWVPCRPGTEGILALGIAHAIISGKLSLHDAHSRAGALIAGWAEGLPDYTPDMVEKQTGVPAATIDRLAHGIAQSGLSTAIIGGMPLAQSNGLFNALAVNALVSLVDPDNQALSGFMPQSPLGGSALAGAKVQDSFAALSALTKASPKLLMLYNANPVFGAPPSLPVRDAIAKIPFVVSFGSFVDETSSMADLILPDHAALESWLDHIPESGAAGTVASLAAPAVHPLYDTRPMPEVLLNLALGLGGLVAAALPYKTFDEMLRAAFAPLRKRPGGSITGADDDDDFWDKVQEAGGWWSAADSAKVSRPAPPTPAPSHAPVKLTAPQFDGDPTNYAFYFLPYASQAFRDGSLAHLPWLQEMPDALTTAMWSSWVEINVKTAQRLGIGQGDLVEVESQHGKLSAPVMLSPGIAPDAVGMPIGQGHSNFSRYASGRGANPLSILAPVTDSETGSLAWAATRVKLTKVGGPDQAKLILFSGGLSRFPHPELEPR